MKIRYKGPFAAVDVHDLTHNFHVLGVKQGDLVQLQFGDEVIDPPDEMVLNMLEQVDNYEPGDAATKKAWNAELRRREKEAAADEAPAETDGEG